MGPCRVPLPLAPNRSIVPARHSPTKPSHACGMPRLHPSFLIVNTTEVAHPSFGSPVLHSQNKITLDPSIVLVPASYCFARQVLNQPSSSRRRSTYLVRTLFPPTTKPL